MGQGAALTMPLHTRRTALAAAVLAPWVLTSCKSQRAVGGGFVGVSAERGHLLREARKPQTPSVTHTVHTVIAGGGVAGLSAARALRLQGIDDFALLELEDSAGGNARASTMAGITHPLGAHYLPVPSDDVPEVQDYLEELGLRQRIGGRWQYDERHLCHSPQERLYFNGAWQDGLLPLAGVSAATLAQYGRFARLVDEWRRTGGFQIPVRATAQARQCQAQLARPFAQYLAEQDLSDPHLLWYLDYCCRDDYGAGAAAVSAWAGIHYFAARHGFAAPGYVGGSVQVDTDKGSGVLTWPEGNARLTRALALPLKERLHTGRVVVRIAESASGVTVDALNVQTQTTERWLAQRCIVALPIFVAQRVLENAPAFMQQAARHTSYASWLVANVHINAALQETEVSAAGVPAAWDNVIYRPAAAAGDTHAASGGLGYVDAMHQSTRTAPGPTVLTYYRALGGSLEARRKLWATPWAQHQSDALADLATAHPDIYQRATQVDITRYGHAMAVPTTDFVQNMAQLWPALASTEGPGRNANPLAYAPRQTPRTQRLRFAHSDWSGYSVFEEAFTRGLHAAL
jgi:phytoene dehydrogenase-like protein